MKSSDARSSRREVQKRKSANQNSEGCVFQVLLSCEARCTLTWERSLSVKGAPISALAELFEIILLLSDLILVRLISYHQSANHLSAAWMGKVMLPLKGKKVERILISLVVLVFFLISPASAEQMKVLNAGTPVCETENQINEILKAIENKDKEHVDALLEDVCFVTEKELKYSLIDSTSTGKVQIRIYGDEETRVVWTGMLLMNH